MLQQIRWRRGSAALWLLLMMVPGANADFAPPADNLAQSGAVAAAAGVPIVLYVSRSDCTFCRRLESRVLAPLVKSGALTGSAILRELSLDQQRLIRDFNGQPVPAQTLARRYEATVTPTLLFLDAAGQPLADAIRGYRDNDYFSYYIEAAVADSQAMLRDAARQTASTARAPATPSQHPGPESAAAVRNPDPPAARQSPPPADQK